ncbi:dihydrofolate reductase [Leucobacter exalbidus]|uniref:dihydrofolate reductase n=1 Tax=Leucobacter exalbidus TaxID=662960 RepID=A0A940PV32_9MICO|nr:dihydrofolate reductase [Leucobacter exalbidus]
MTDTAAHTVASPVARIGLGLIWAEARGGVIGKAGTMPWHLPEDLAHFKRTTLGAPVIMGRRTWESLPERVRPLPGRPNIVVTRNGEYEAPGATVVSSVAAGMAAAAECVAAEVPAEASAEASAETGTVWNIGGAELFHASMDSATELVVTRIEADIEGADTFAPAIGPEWTLASRGDLQRSSTGLEFRIERWVKLS